MNSDAATGFWNLIANLYAKQKIADQTAYQYKLDATQKLLNDQSVVFEFGCGSGSTALYHAPLVKKLIAIDTSKKMIKIANEKLQQSSSSNLKFELGKIDDYQEASGTFDVVLGLNVLHLIPTWKQVIHQVHALLKPDGYFISSTACIAEKSAFLKTLAPLGALGILPRIQFFTGNELVEAMENSGFRIQENSTPGKDKAIKFIIARKK